MLTWNKFVAWAFPALIVVMVTWIGNIITSLDKTVTGMAIDIAVIKQQIKGLEK